MEKKRKLFSCLMRVRNQVLIIFIALQRDESIHMVLPESSKPNIVFSHQVNVGAFLGVSTLGSAHLDQSQK